MRKSIKTKANACFAHPDCFANHDHLCVALMDTNFGERDCPFYKNCNRARTEQVDVLESLLRKGRMEMIEQYYKGEHFTVLLEEARERIRSSALRGTQ